MSNIASVKEPARKKWIRNLAILAYIDLLYFPYFQTIIIPYSLPLIIAGTVVIGKDTLPPNTKMILWFLAFFMFLSLGVSVFLPDSELYVAENLKRVLQFWTSFFYLAFFYSVAKYHKIQNALRVISLIFLVYFSILLGWFYFDPVMVNNILNQVYGRLVTPYAVLLIHYRFAYLFTDPNTAGYFLIIAVMPWIVFYRNKVTRTAIVLMCVVIAVFIQSRGVLLGLVLGILLHSFPFRLLVLRFRMYDFWSIVKLSVISTLMGTIVTVLIVKYFSNIPIFEMSLDRISSMQDYLRGGNRFEIWQRYATSLIPLPLGRGYMFDTIHGKFFPHSDFVRLLYSYGFVSAGLFIWWVIRSSWKYPLVLMPALMAFGVNTLIDEQKLFALFLATLGVYLGINKKSPVTKRIYILGDPRLS